MSQTLIAPALIIIVSQWFLYIFLLVLLCKLASNNGFIDSNNNRHSIMQIHYEKNLIQVNLIN